MVDYLQHAYGLGPDAAGRDHAFGITVLDFPAHVLSLGAGLAVVEKPSPGEVGSAGFRLGEQLVEQGKTQESDRGEGEKMTREFEAKREKEKK